MPRASRYDVEMWLRTIATGEFHYKEVLDGQVDSSSFGNLRKIMFELSKGETAIIEPVGRRDGYYRVISDSAKPIDWQGVESKREFPLIIPFDLRRSNTVVPSGV